MNGWRAAVALCGWTLAIPVCAEPLLFVPVSGGASVQVIDTRSATTATHIPLPNTPIGIAIDAQQGKVYVSHQQSQRVSKIDARTRQVDGQLLLPTDAWGIALSPDGLRAYVALSGSDQLAIIDTASMSVIGTVAVGTTPRNVEVSADGARVYVSNQFGSSLSVVDAVQQSLVGSFALCSGPLGLALRADGAVLYVACALEDRLLRFDTTTHALLGFTETGSRPSEVLISPDGTRIYVSATNANSVTVIDGASHEVLTSIAVGDGPYGMSISADGARLYVSNLHSNSVQVIDTKTYATLTDYSLVAAAFAVGGMLAPAGVPDRPSIGAVQGGNGSAVVNFVAPGFDGGSAVTGFTASCGDRQQSGTPPSITISGLVSGDTYSCSVRASNSVGDSLPSAAVSVIASALPGAPQLVAATPGTEQALLSFDPPADNGGSGITQYIAQCNPGAVQACGSNSPLLVAGLTDNLVYRCAVRARNVIGDGPASAELSVIPGDSGIIADLSINKSNATDFVSGGQREAYLITVTNAGPAAVVDARVSDVFEHYFSDVQWQCGSANGARCAESGVGNLDASVDLPVNSSVQIQISALLAPLPENPVFNLTTVSIPAGMIDPELVNNVASDGPDVRGVFRDGFE